MQDREESLVLRARQREAEAFGELYELYFNRIFRYVALKVRDLAEAEDITEEVFLKAWEAIESYDLQGLPFTAWLFRIARNATVDRWRQKARRPEAPLPEGIGLLSEDPVQKCEARLVREELLQAIQHLTEGQRQAIALRFGGGLSVIETAKAMDKTEGAIKALQHSGIKTLRRLLVREK